MREVKYDKYYQNIINWKIPEKEKIEIMKFFKDYELGKITGRTSDKSTQETYILYLKTSLEYFNKLVPKITEKDIDALCSDLLRNNIKSKRPGNTDFSDSVKGKIKKILMQYLTWRIKDVKKLALLLKSLKIRTPKKERTPEFLTEQEVDKIYKNCRNAEERYLIAVLFSSGARAGEFINIRQDDFELPKNQDNFVKLTMRGEFSKTKGRTISLYYKNALEAVNEFLNQRIREGIQPDEPVWKMSPIATIKKINSFGKIKTRDKKTKEIRYIGRKAVDKILHMHLFRSSCATWLANRLNRQELCYYFGWRFSSPMPDVYISRKGMIMKEVDDKFTHTELSELKLKLDNQEYQNKLKAEEFELQKQELTHLKKKTAVLDDFAELGIIFKKLSQSKEHMKKMYKLVEDMDKNPDWQYSEKELEEMRQESQD